MTKRKFEVEMYSYGEYAKWDRNCREIPKLLDITDVVKADVDTEFGYVLIIKKAKGKVIDYRIDHPSFKGDDGKVMPPFTGQVFINANYYKFFLGDCVWAPAHDKMGVWKMTTKIDGEIVAQKALRIIPK